MHKNKLSIVSLFSGCGGLDTGFKLASDCDVVFANDKYAPACETHSVNLGLPVVRNASEVARGTIFLGTVADVDFGRIGKADIIIGGVPCQDFSLLRGKEKRRGIEVERGQLYLHFVRALIALQPSMFVMENVSGLISANGGLAYKTIREDFEKLDVRKEELAHYWEFGSGYRAGNGVMGYRILYSAVVDFSKLGVPQKRERLIMIGLREDLARSLGSDLSGITGDIKRKLSGRDAVFAQFPLTTIEAFEGKPLGELDEAYRHVMMEYESSVNTCNSRRAIEYRKDVWGKYTFNAWADYLRMNRINGALGLDRQAVEDGHMKVLEELGYLGKPLEGVRFNDGTNEPNNETESVKARMACIPPNENFEFVMGTDNQVLGLMSNVYKRVHPLLPSPTVIARGGGGTWGYHYAQSRQRLTNRERARLQTFPDSFIFRGRPSEIRRQIGEAVPPLAAKRVAECTLEVFDALSM